MCLCRIDIAFFEVLPKSIFCRQFSGLSTVWRQTHLWGFCVCSGDTGFPWKGKLVREDDFWKPFKFWDFAQGLKSDYRSHYMCYIWISHGKRWNMYWQFDILRLAWMSSEAWRTSCRVCRTTSHSTRSTLTTGLSNYSTRCIWVRIKNKKIEIITDSECGCTLRSVSPSIRNSWRNL